MFTVLSIERRIYRGVGRKLVERLPVNSMTDERVQGEGFSFYKLKYIQRSSRINYKKIGKHLRKNGVPVVCDEKESAVSELKIKPFIPTELRQRLCINMALEVLSIMEEVPREMRVGIYDPEGDFCDIPELLLKYTDNLAVVTKNHRVYSARAAGLLAETGAVLCLSRKISSLQKCDFIIAPAPIKEKFIPKTSAVVLTCCEPRVSLCCRVFYKYFFRLRREYDSLRDETTDAEDFGGALYSLCGIYSIGSTVPFVCVNGSDSQTTLSLKKYLTEQMNT